MRSTDWVWIGMAWAILAGVVLVFGGCAPGGSIIVSSAPISEDDLLTCEIDSDAPRYQCQDGKTVATPDKIQWHTSEGSEEWRPAIRQALAWWEMEIGVESVETVDGPGVEIGWHEMHCDHVSAHAHRPIDQDRCEMGDGGWIRIDYEMVDTWDDSLMAHELGHLLGYMHDDHGVMHPELWPMRVDCGRAIEE